MSTEPRDTQMNKPDDKQTCYTLLHLLLLARKPTEGNENQSIDHSITQKLYWVQRKWVNNYLLTIQNTSLCFNNSSWSPPMGENHKKEMS